MTAEEKATQREIDRMEPVERYINELISTSDLDGDTKTLIAGNLRNFWNITLKMGGRIECEGWGLEKPGFDVVRTTPYELTIDGIRVSTDVLRYLLISPNPKRWLRLQRRDDDSVLLFTMADHDLAQEIITELEKARRHGDKFASLHEAYAVVLEELDEIWDFTRQKRRERNGEELRKEFIQLGAMALKGLLSLQNFTGGEV